MYLILLSELKKKKRNTGFDEHWLTLLGSLPSSAPVSILVLPVFDFGLFLSDFWIISV